MSESKSKSSWKDSLKSRKYEEHKHCVVCGNAILTDRDFCGTTCKESYTKADKKKSRSSKIQLIVMGVVMVVLLVLMPLLTGA
jgi:predicted nucleic acid-binding Zn ribbon protein